MSAKTKKMNERTPPKNLKTLYYVLCDKSTGRPKVSVVVGCHDGQVCRGLSICSDSEFREGFGFVERDGYKIAKRRMFRAFNRQENTGSIIGDKAISVISKVAFPKDTSSTVWLLFFSNKSQFNPELLAYEIKGLNNGRLA